MIKGFLKVLIYVFIGIGIALFTIAVVGIVNDRAIHFSGLTDWGYLKKVAEVCAFLAVPWNIAGVFLLYLTLNVQQKQFEKTDSYIRQQQFETTFFNMLNVLSRVKESIYYEYDSIGRDFRNVSNEKRGQEFFDYSIKKLDSQFQTYYSELEDNGVIKEIIGRVSQNTSVNKLETNIIRDDLNLIYLSFYHDYHNQLGHYFRYVYNLIKFAIQNRENDGDEKKYIDLLQAQLTNDELSLIFYNAYSDNGLNNNKEYKFHEWLDKYNFFENIDDRSLLLREHHIFYPKTKFKFLNTDELSLKQP